MQGPGCAPKLDSTSHSNDEPAGRLSCSIAVLSPLPQRWAPRPSPRRWSMAQAKLEKPKVTIAVGGKNLLYYLPLTIAEQLGYFKDEGLDVDDRRLRRRLARAAGAWSAAAPTSSRAPSSTPSTCRPRASACAPSCCRGGRRRSCSASTRRRCRTTRRVADLKGKKIGVTAPGSSTNVMANFVLAQGRAEAERRLDHRRRRRQRRGRGDALGPDRRDLQPRPGDHACCSAAGDLKIISDTRIVAEADKVFGGPMPAGCLYAPQSLHRQEPEHRARRWPTPSCAPTSGSRPPGRATSSRRCPRATCSATARSTSTPSSPPRARSRPTA